MITDVKEHMPATYKIFAADLIIIGIALCIGKCMCKIL